ncbi:MAG: hypothetical protein ACQEQF_04955 [Bacillota bacterium]
MKYSYPKEINNKKDIIVFFAEYFEEKFGYYMPKRGWGKTASFVTKMVNEGYTLEEIAIVVWGKINTCDKVKSIWYCKYDFDKIDFYKKIKKQEKNKPKETKPEYEDTEEKANKEGDILDEFL